jgi:hydrogenase maturation protease
MNLSAVEKIADAVLYEGYVLYPYRPSSVKNRQRFNFGVLCPREYCDFQGGVETCESTTECLVHGTAMSRVEIKVRFLHLSTRESWQEGHERDVAIQSDLTDLLKKDLLTKDLFAGSLRCEFTFNGWADAEGRVAHSLRGELDLGATPLGEDLYRIRLTIRNLTGLDNSTVASRDEALLRSLISVHSVLHIVDGEFISLLDPPASLKEAAGACRNSGTWPVLAGTEGQHDLMLSSPIILYDYPQIAPESAGDLCDGTEIDEILALRILTMTDAEKLEVRNGDDRARRILERTELLPPEHFQKLHGAIRGIRTSAAPQTQEAPA